MLELLAGQIIRMNYSGSITDVSGITVGLSTGTHKEHTSGDALHSAALKAVSEPIMNAIDSAETLGGVLSAKDAKARFL